MKCLSPHFVFVGYFAHDIMFNLNRDYDLRYWKVYHYFFQSKPNNSAYITVTSQQQRWYWALDNINKKISLLYSLYSCKIRCWSLRFCQFGACQVLNTTQSSTLLHSCLLNKWAKISVQKYSRISEISWFLCWGIFGPPCSRWPFNL